MTKKQAASFPSPHAMTGFHSQRSFVDFFLYIAWDKVAGGKNLTLDVPSNLTSVSN